MASSLRRAHRPWLAAVLLGTFLVYVPGLGNDFTYDARHYAMGTTPDGVPNYMVIELRPLLEYFKRPMHYGVTETGRGYRPVTVLSYALVHDLFKRHGSHSSLEPVEAPAWPSHLLDLLLHVLATFLAWRLVAQVCGAGPPALVAAAVFGLHALRSDVVLSIVGRAEILGFVCGAAAVLLYQRSLRLLAMASLFLAFCSKESAVAWAVFLPLHVWARHQQRKEQEPFPFRQTAIDWLWVCLLPLVVFLALRGLMLMEYLKEEFIVGYRQNPLFHLQDQPTKVLATAVMMLGYGLYKVFVPFFLACDYGAHVFPIVGLGDYRFLLAALVLAGILAGGMWVARRAPLLFLATCVFFGFAFITSNILVLAEANFAERFYYTPAMGLSFLAAFLADKLRSGAARRSGLAVLVVWLVACTGVCVKRCFDWRDNQTLFQHDVRAQPRSVSIRMYLSGFARRRGDMQEWRHHLEKALEIDDKSPDPLNSMGAWHIANGTPAQAVECLTRALRSPYYHDRTLGGLVHENLGYAYHALGDIPAAERALMRALECEPSRFSAMRMLLELATARGDRGLLEQRLELARQRFPEPSPVLDMYAGLSAFLGGDPATAAQLLGRALPVLDQAPEQAGGFRALVGGWHVLARSLFLAGRTSESARIVRRFLEMPDLPARQRQMFLRLAQDLERR